MLYTIAVILLVVWAIGLFLNIVGGLIHLLLLAAAALVVYRLVKGRGGSGGSHITSS